MSFESSGSRRRIVVHTERDTVKRMSSFIYDYAVHPRLSIVLELDKFKRFDGCGRCTRTWGSILRLVADLFGIASGEALTKML